MLNEVLLCGYLSGPPTEDLTKNGKRMVTARFVTTNIDDSGRAWRTHLPVIAFGKSADRLLSYAADNLLIVRGRLSWSGESGGVVVAARDVSIFSTPVAAGDDLDG
jgi:single-stranded DNA-binding protein